MLVMLRAAVCGALTKNIQLLTTPCTRNAFRSDGTHWMCTIPQTLSHTYMKGAGHKTKIVHGA